MPLWTFSPNTVVDKSCRSLPKRDVSIHSFLAMRPLQPIEKGIDQFKKTKHTQQRIGWIPVVLLQMYKCIYIFFSFFLLEHKLSQRNISMPTVLLSYDGLEQHDGVSDTIPTNFQGELESGPCRPLSIVRQLILTWRFRIFFFFLFHFPTRTSTPTKTTDEFWTVANNKVIDLSAILEKMKSMVNFITKFWRWLHDDVANVVVCRG